MTKTTRPTISPRPTRYHPGARVGATYWAKKTEGSFPDWVMGIGVVNKLEKRTKRELPEVGDILASINQGHHGVITWVDPAATPPKTNNEWDQIQIKTVEANINGQIVETPASHSTLAYWTVGVLNLFLKTSSSHSKRAEK